MENEYYNQKCAQALIFWHSEKLVLIHFFFDIFFSSPVFGALMYMLGTWAGGILLSVLLAGAVLGDPSRSGFLVLFLQLLRLF